MFQVEDIDKDDQTDPQLVTEYVNQIYVYLRHLEKDQSVEKDYLGNKKGWCTLHFKWTPFIMNTNGYSN